MMQVLKFNARNKIEWKAQDYLKGEHNATGNKFLNDQKL